MPELPEVETIKRDLSKYLVGKKITDFFATEKARIRLATYENFKKNILNKKVLEVNRLGKQLVFKLDENLFILIHLKMTGQLIYQKNNKIITGGHSENKHILCLPDRSTRAIFSFNKGEKMYFNDLRRFGFIKLINLADLSKIKKELAFDPVIKSFTKKYFFDKLRTKKTNLKAYLLNQKNISGIGNIYADEICFDARIKPFRKINSLTKAEKVYLYNSIKKIINKAIKERGTTFNNYVDSDGNKGNYVKYLKVYDREAKNCKRCGGTVKKIKLAGRGTHFCPKCQK